jgi:hypothetical protein
MKDLKFLTICPDMYYTWQVHLWLDSFKRLNSDKNYCALFVPKGRTQNTKWDQIISFIS